MLVIAVRLDQCQAFVQIKPAFEVSDPMIRPDRRILMHARADSDLLEAISIAIHAEELRLRVPWVSAFKDY